MKKLFLILGLLILMVSSLGCPPLTPPVAGGYHDGAAVAVVYWRGCSGDYIEITFYSAGIYEVSFSSPSLMGSVPKDYQFDINYIPQTTTVAKDQLAYILDITVAYEGRLGYPVDSWTETHRFENPNIKTK